MSKTNCTHEKLVLLPAKKNRLCCRHCHLTIKEDELEQDYCPECYESKGRKLYDFEEVRSHEKEIVTYRCEECNLMIKC